MQTCPSLFASHFAQLILPYPEGRHPQVDQEIVLNSEGLHADEISTAEVLRLLREDTELILAVGSGTIHDIARFCACRRGLRFVSVPTAASMDGYCSSVASMTWQGFKKTIPAVAPELVIADVEIIREAPPVLVCSGFGDILAKYTALADWEIAHSLAGEYLCPRIHEMMRLAAEMATESITGLITGSDRAWEEVIRALILSGLAMQMMGNSRPASGAEHHISHLIEMKPVGLTVRFPALHGEKTGIGSLLVSQAYHRLAAMTDIQARLRPYRPPELSELQSFFGAPLAGDIMQENRNDCLAAVTPDTLMAAWPDICRIVSGIPNPKQLEAALIKLGAKHTPEEIGVSTADVDTLLRYSPLVRNRLTLMRLRRMIDE